MAASQLDVMTVQQQHQQQQQLHGHVHVHMYTSVCVTVQSTDPISTTHIGLKGEQRQRQQESSCC